MQKSVYHAVAVFREQCVNGPPELRRPPVSEDAVLEVRPIYMVRVGTAIAKFRRRIVVRSDGDDNTVEETECGHCEGALQLQLINADGLNGQVPQSHTLVIRTARSFLNSEEFGN